MSSELIAWIVAVALGVAVICLGLRRDLGEVTRSWLPRFGEGSEDATEVPGPADGWQKPRQLSPRQRKWAIWFYLLIGLLYAVIAVLQADGRLLHVISAATFSAGAVLLILKGPPSPLDGFSSRDDRG